MFAKKPLPMGSVPVGVEAELLGLRLHQRCTPIRAHKVSGTTYSSSHSSQSSSSVSSTCPDVPVSPGAGVLVKVESTRVGAALTRGVVVRTDTVEVVEMAVVVVRGREAD